MWRAPAVAASHRLGPSARQTTIPLPAAAAITRGTPISVASPFFPFTERSISKSWKRWPGRQQWSCQAWRASAYKRGRLEPGLVCRAQILSSCATASLQSSRTSHQHRLGHGALFARFGPSSCRCGCCFRVYPLSTERYTLRGQLRSGYAAAGATTMVTEPSGNCIASRDEYVGNTQ